MSEKEISQLHSIIVGAYYLCREADSMNLGSAADAIWSAIIKIYSKYNNELSEHRNSDKDNESLSNAILFIEGIIKLSPKEKGRLAELIERHQDMPAVVH